MNKIARCFVEGCKLVVLFGAVALVVWTMPDEDPLKLEAVAVANLAETR